MIGEEELVELFRTAPKESFELLLRNIRIRRILEDLYKRHEAGIKLSYGEEFERIFEEFFRFFFRPLEVAVYGGRQLEFMFPRVEFISLFEAQAELLNAYTEFLRSLYDHVRLTASLYAGYVLPKAEKDVLERFVEIYRERMSRFRSEFMRIDLSTEFPFLLPKSVFLRFESALENLREFSSAFRKFRELVKSSYVKGAQSFIDKANSKKFDSYNEFANAFFEEEARIFDELLRSEDYLKTQKAMLDSLMDYIYNARSFYEELAMSNPLNPFATISLMDEAFKRIYELRRKIRELEKRIERMGGVGDVGGEDKGD
ncbi:hypothetical protein Ferp_1420 [Ferroglobus placidus DSM 10642]|uniref:Uncharacterized protein n=1 Tax=Ferroglobus placidus (strain DSM 10642 / AEDII12DO) TaxID=589924 RepID=D3RYK8_FERPA|nr:poly(R)-hydroxyalkanoic acid synthase subunit PhaE [Ferroglobus placidus]ADC65571.1 hypothetical protein Ferp_1420 [Ferroglobus placidus DSM 10642]